MTEKNQNDKKIHIVPDVADMIKQLHTVINMTDDSSYTVEQLRDLLIENNKHIAEKNGFVAPSTEYLYEIFTKNFLDKLVGKGVLLKTISNGEEYYKI